MLGEGASTIRDYALSTYFIYYAGENIRTYRHLKEWAEDEFLEYDT